MNLRDPLLTDAFFKVEGLTAKVELAVPLTLPANEEGMATFLNSSDGDYYRDYIKTIISSIKKWYYQYSYWSTVSASGLNVISEAIQPGADIGSQEEKAYQLFLLMNVPLLLTGIRNSLEAASIGEIRRKNTRDIKRRVAVLKDLLWKLGRPKADILQHLNHAYEYLTSLEILVTFPVPTNPKKIFRFFASQKGVKYFNGVERLINKLIAWAEKNDLEIAKDKLQAFLEKWKIQEKKGEVGFTFYKEAPAFLAGILMELEKTGSDQKNSLDTRKTILKNLCEGWGVCLPIVLANFCTAYLNLVPNLPLLLMNIRKEFAKQTIVECFRETKFSKNPYFINTGIKNFFARNEIHYINSTLNYYSSELGIKKIEDYHAPTFGKSPLKDIEDKLQASLKKALNLKNLINYIVTSKTQGIHEALKNISHESYAVKTTRINEILNLYGEDEDFSIKVFLDEEAFEEDEYKLKTTEQINRQIFITLVQRLQKLGYIDLAPFPQIALTDEFTLCLANGYANYAVTINRKHELQAIQDYLSAADPVTIKKFATAIVPHIMDVACLLSFITVIPEPFQAEQLTFVMRNLDTSREWLTRKSLIDLLNTLPTNLQEIFYWYYSLANYKFINNPLLNTYDRVLKIFKSTYACYKKLNDGNSKKLLVKNIIEIINFYALQYDNIFSFKNYLVTAFGSARNESSFVEFFRVVVVNFFAYNDYKIFARFSNADYATVFGELPADMQKEFFKDFSRDVVVKIFESNLLNFCSTREFSLSMFSALGLAYVNTKIVEEPILFLHKFPIHIRGGILSHIDINVLCEACEGIPLDIIAKLVTWLCPDKLAFTLIKKIIKQLLKNNNYEVYQEFWNTPLQSTVFFSMLDYDEIIEFMQEFSVDYIVSFAESNIGKYRFLRALQIGVAKKLSEEYINNKFTTLNELATFLHPICRRAKIIIYGKIHSQLAENLLNSEDSILGFIHDPAKRKVLYYIIDKITNSHFKRIFPDLINALISVHYDSVNKNYFEKFSKLLKNHIIDLMPNEKEAAALGQEIKMFGKNSGRNGVSIFEEEFLPIYHIIFKQFNENKIIEATQVLKNIGNLSNIYNRFNKYKQKISQLIEIDLLAIDKAFERLNPANADLDALRNAIKLCEKYLFIELNGVISIINLNRPKPTSFLYGERTDGYRDKLCENLNTMPNRFHYPRILAVILQYFYSVYDNLLIENDLPDDIIWQRSSLKRQIGGIKKPLAYNFLPDLVVNTPANEIRPSISLASLPHNDYVRRMQR